MVTTMRSSEKNISSRGKGDEYEQVAGTKHQVDTKTAPSPKRSKTEKEQKTLEETIPHTAEDNRKAEGQDDGRDTQYTQDTQKTQGEEPQDDGNSAVKDEGRSDVDVANSILEKGVIYFFFRGRVGIDNPESVDDVSRSFFVLRPMHQDAKLGEGSIQDAGNSRIIAVPKKVFPTSGKERWLAFVEKADASFHTLKEGILSGAEYETKTAGTRHTPPGKPIAEGVYTITTTGRESHLVYKLTIPSELGDVQTAMGLRQSASFILSTRNPAYDAPKNVALPESPNYPKEIQDSFRALRWAPTRPAHLDYPSSQFLLIGEAGHVDKAMAPQANDKEADREEPAQELDKLEDEDTHRMEHLKGDESEAVLADLRLRSDEYPKIQTTF